MQLNSVLPNSVYNNSCFFPFPTFFLKVRTQPNQGFGLLLFGAIFWNKNWREKNKSIKNVYKTEDKKVEKWNQIKDRVVNKNASEKSTESKTGFSRADHWITCQKTYYTFGQMFYSIIFIFVSFYSVTFCRPGKCVQSIYRKKGRLSIYRLEI